MDKLIDILQPYIERYQGLEQDELFPDNLKSIYPFNNIEYIFAHLLSKGIMSIEEYKTIRNRYLVENKNLPLFEITAPRTFGETWAQKHLNELVPSLKKPAKKYDSSYSGQYDFYYDGIKIEVKASRAVDSKKQGSLILKALSSDTKKSFNMNFQQIKPACCDVFVWIAVWRDKIDYWILSSDEVAQNPYYSHGQHRGNSGEGQLWITEGNIREFDQYLTQPENILAVIVAKSQQNRISAL